VKQTLSRLLTEVWALGRPPRGLRILLYHSIGGDLPDGTYRPIPVHCFREQMAMLKAGARVVPLERSSLREANGVAVTFDDGYRDALTMAAPVLAALEIPFTVFVVPAFLTANDSAYLTPEQLRALARVLGCRIGAHGMHHRPLADLPAEEAYAEPKHCREALEAALGQPVTDLAYPHGSASRAVMDAAARAGFTLAVCSRTGVNDAARDPLMLCRTEILARDGARASRHKLRGAWDWHRWRHPDPARR